MIFKTFANAKLFAEEIAKRNTEAAENWNCSFKATDDKFVSLNYLNKPNNEEKKIEYFEEYTQVRMAMQSNPEFDFTSDKYIESYVYTLLTLINESLNIAFVPFSLVDENFLGARSNEYYQFNTSIGEEQYIVFISKKEEYNTDSGTNKPKLYGSEYVNDDIDGKRGTIREKLEGKTFKKETFKNGDFVEIHTDGELPSYIFINNYNKHKKYL